jgi:hypothetical protein
MDSVIRCLSGAIFILFKLMLRVGTKPTLSLELYKNYVYIALRHLKGVDSKTS